MALTQEQIDHWLREFNLSDDTGMDFQAFLISHERMPNVLVDTGSRTVVITDGFKEWARPGELPFVLGHEAGHAVMGHHGGPRNLQSEMDADIWGLLALRAHGLHDNVSWRAIARLDKLMPSWESPHRIANLKAWAAKNPEVGK